MSKEEGNRVKVDEEIQQFEDDEFEAFEDDNLDLELEENQP
jgi:hypothetical protein